MKVQILFITIVSSIVVGSADEASDQLVTYKDKTKDLPIPTLTTGNGAPVEMHETDATLNADIFRNRYLIETLTHLARERIPERVVHAKGTGAFGYFEVTSDISHLTKAKLFSTVGQQTPIAVRFSLTFGNLGTADTTRGSRGFAVKFYTEEGNFDLPALHTPVFPINDPVVFNTFVHVNQKNPATNLLDLNMFWDYVTKRPECMNSFLRLFSDYGVPAGWQYMPGFSIHTYELVNAQGEHNFVRFHLRPEAGIQNLNASYARTLAGSDPDYATRLLYNAIATEEYPAWTVSLQVLSLEDVQNAGFDVFDTTKELPIADYPLRDIGRMVLNRNPSNHFAEMEQIQFLPANLVPGILGAPDKLFEARQFLYRDAQNYRLGSNFDKIDVNRPYRAQVYTYERDGVPPVGSNELDGPNYFFNSFNGPEPYVDEHYSTTLSITHDGALNFDQAADFFNNQLTEEEQTNTVASIVGRLKEATSFLQERALALFNEIDKDLAARIIEALAESSKS